MKNLLIIAFIYVLLAGCDQQPKAIEERAQARWDALLGDDIKTAYKYLTPGYRSSVSFEQYLDELGRNRVAWVAAEYKNHQCEAEACEVDISLTYRIVRPLPGVDEWESSRDVKEKWVQVKDRWYFYPEK